MPTQGFVLAILPGPFTVFVALVCGHVNQCLDPDSGARGFEQIHDAHDVYNRIRLGRVLVGIPDQGLRCEMENNFRLNFPERGGKLFKVADVCNGQRCHSLANSGNGKEVRAGRRRE